MADHQKLFTFIQPINQLAQIILTHLLETESQAFLAKGLILLVSGPCQIHTSIKNVSTK
ncbi:hypothetical protein [Leptolyngbya sp. FACHB-16]|uniref:hypothetical protein n=1 Tax=unclassified Leptolyngbya TaxID=2650499 RepID=UPI00198CCBB5|nr:hypothetical protein [Leptolyngbya sp. FACHB-16]MBD2157611.1 hypothetical protein [Leptolyngbya sp. FACHB-16]